MNTATPDPQDDHLRSSAQAFQDRVLDTVDVEAALAESQRPSRRPVAIVVSVLAVVALVAGAFVLGPAADDGDVDVAIDEDGLEDPDPETSTPETPTPETPTPDFENAPAPIGLGAPDDGKESVGLPVVVEPATGLTDGQSVSVSGKGFPPGESIGVVMCGREAGQDHGARGVDACNIGHFGQGTADREGNVTIPFSVRRIVVLDGQEIDCASEPGRCIVGMGMISDYDQSGGFAVDFDPSVPLPAPPTVELSKTEGIVDGETVDVVVTGLVPNSYVYLQQCARDAHCVQTSHVQDAADDDGTYRGSIRLWRTFGGYGQSGPENVDCAVDACRLLVGADLSSSRIIPEVEVSFDPNRGKRTPPVLRVLDDGPFTAGERFRVAVDGTRAGDIVDLQICPDDHDCIAYGNASTEDGTTVVEMFVDSAGSCGDACLIIAHVFPENERGLGDGGPPPLYPEPVAVTITG